MIDPQTVAKILDAAQISEVVSDFVTLRKRGVNYIGLCPFHDEKTGSFTVSPAKGIFKCFGCGKGGSSVHFIMEHEHLDYPGALRYLAKKYHIEIVEKELTEEEKVRQSDRESLFAINEYANRYFQQQLHNHADGVAIGLSYFRSRGFTDDIIKKFQLGYCLDESGSFAQSALREGYKNEFLEKSGLSIRRDDGSYYDRFRGRVIFPVHTLSGKVVAFGGRILKKNDKSAKYVNSPESEIYHKSNELYGVYFAKQHMVKHDRVFLVEGYTDVISMHQAGIENVVASSGTALTPGQIKLIHRFTPNVTVLYDGDAAGIKASIRGIDLLLEEGMHVKVVLLPDGEDPDSFSQSRNATEFIDFIDKNQVDFMRFKTDLLLKDAQNDPMQKVQLIHEIVRSISLMPDKIAIETYIKECAGQMDMDESLLRSEVCKLQRKKKQEYAKQKDQERRRQEQRATDLSDATNVPSHYDVTDIPPPPDEDWQPPADYQDYQGQPNLEAIADTISAASPIRFDTEEKNILEFLVRYGERIICEELVEQDTDDTSSASTARHISVAEFISEEMHALDLTFHNPLHTLMLSSYLAQQYTVGLRASTFFVSHPDAQISLLSAELISDRYQLSKIHRKLDDMPPTFNAPPPNPYDYDAVRRYEDQLKQFERDVEQFESRKEYNFIEQLGNQVHRVVIEYAQSVVLEELKQLMLKLKLPENAAPENMKSIMMDMNELQEKKRHYAKLLGERVIIKL